ncbi:MAG: chorismate mutase [Bryobacteraceae bacterium]|jgi:chorismate mutase|nr:chorismate mutase [Bryobacteraceae bacterium]
MTKAVDPQRALARYRTQIDKIDRDLLGLLNRRGRIAQKIGAVKREHSLAIVEPAREQQVVANLIAANSGPLANDAIERIFLGVMIEMRNLQRKEDEC